MASLPKPAASWTSPWASWRSARARIARNEAEKGAAVARREDLARRRESLGAEDTVAAERAVELGASAESLREGLDAMEVRRTDLQARKRRGGSARLRPCKAEVSRGEVELETLREESHRRRSRLASLAEIQERYESFQKGVRAIMQQRREREGAGELSGIRALVADIVQPPPSWRPRSRRCSAIDSATSSSSRTRSASRRSSS